jgi:hypothetical protein
MIHGDETSVNAYVTGVMRPTHSYQNIKSQMLLLDCFTFCRSFPKLRTCFLTVARDSTVSERRGKSECVFLSVTDTSGNYLNMRQTVIGEGMGCGVSAAGATYSALRLSLAVKIVSATLNFVLRICFQSYKAQRSLYVPPV